MDTEKKTEHCCETERQEIKRCPFRKDAAGDFAPCYGASCMAYLEYDQPALSLSDTCGAMPPLHLILCRRMAQPLYFGGGCSSAV